MMAILVRLSVYCEHGKRSISPGGKNKSETLWQAVLSAKSIAIGTQSYLCTRSGCRIMPSS